MSFEKTPLLTTIEQSERLLRWGLDSRSADFGWKKSEMGDYMEAGIGSEDADVPAWSFSALYDIAKSARSFDSIECLEGKTAVDGLVSFIVDNLKFCRNTKYSIDSKYIKKNEIL